MGIQEVDQTLKKFEFSMRDLIQKYNGKQSQRLFSSTVWMVDHLEGQIKNELGSIKNELEVLKTGSDNATIQNNAVISMQHANEIEVILKTIILSYKDDAVLQNINSVWASNIPAIGEKLKSMRHRVDIIKNTFVSKKRIEDEDWYNSL